jgi:hypothetical protein
MFTVPLTVWRACDVPYVKRLMHLNVAAMEISNLPVNSYARYFSERDKSNKTHYCNSCLYDKCAATFSGILVDRMQGIQAGVIFLSFHVVIRRRNHTL